MDSEEKKQECKILATGTSWLRQNARISRRERSKIRIKKAVATRSDNGQQNTTKQTERVERMDSASIPLKALHTERLRELEIEDKDRELIT